MVSRAYQLEGFVKILESWGLRDVLLPFLLIFVVFYAILAKTNILGSGRKNLNVALAIIIALTVVILHLKGYIQPNLDFVNIINKAIPNVSLVVVGLVMFLLIIGLLGAGTGKGAIIGGAGVFVYLIFLWVAFATNINQPIVLMILTFLLAILITGKGEGGNVPMKFVGIVAITIIFFIFIFAAELYKRPAWFNDTTAIGGMVFALLLGLFIGVVARGEAGEHKAEGAAGHH